MTFANSIPDCLPVSQMQEDDYAGGWLGSRGPEAPSAALCLAPAVGTHPPAGLRHSSLTLLFGQEKDSSACVMASTKSGSSSRGMCQPMSDVAFHMENSLHEGGSEEDAGRELCCGTTTDPRRALTTVHYIPWSVRMQTVCCRQLCPGQRGPNLVCTCWHGDQSAPIIYSQLSQ